MKTLTQLCLVYVGELAHRFPEADLADLPVTILSQVLPYLSAAQLHRLDDVFKQSGISTVATWRRHLHQRWPHTHHRYPAVFGEAAPPDPHRHYMEKHFHELLRHAHFGQHTDPSCVLDMCLHHMILMRFPIREPSATVVDQPLRAQLVSFAPYVQRLSITALQCCHLVQSADLMALLQRSVTTLDLHLGQDRYYHNMRAFLLLLLVEGRLEHIALYNTRLMQRHIKDLLRVCAGHFGYQGHQPQLILHPSQRQHQGAAHHVRSPVGDFRVQPSTSSQAGRGSSSHGSSLISPPKLTTLHLKGEGEPVAPTDSFASTSGNHWWSPSDDDNTSGPDEDDDNTGDHELDLYDAALLLPSAPRPHSIMHRHVRLRHAARHGLRFSHAGDSTHNKAAAFYAQPRTESLGNGSDHKKAAAFYAHPQSESSSTDSSPDKSADADADFQMRSPSKSSAKRSLPTASLSPTGDEPYKKIIKTVSEENVKGEVVTSVKSDILKEDSLKMYPDGAQEESSEHSQTLESEPDYVAGSSPHRTDGVDSGAQPTDCKQDCIAGTSVEMDCSTSTSDSKQVLHSEGAPTSSSSSFSQPAEGDKPDSIDSSLDSSNSVQTDTSSVIDPVARAARFVIAEHRPASPEMSDSSEPGSPPLCCKEDAARTVDMAVTSSTAAGSLAGGDGAEAPLLGVKSMAVIECIECLGGNLGTYLAAVLPTWTGLENLTLTSTRTRSMWLSDELLCRLQAGQLRSLVLEDTPLCDNVLCFLTRALVAPRTKPLKVIKLSNNLQELRVRDSDSVDVEGPFVGTEKLDLSYNTFMQSGILHLSQLLRHDTALSHLCLEACHFSESEVIALLKATQENGRLETLSLAENLLSINSQYEVIRTINALPRLKSLNLNTCLIDTQIAVSDDFVSAVLRHPRLERLTLATNRLGGAGCQLLQRVLDGCYGNDASSGNPAVPLRWLDLGYNCIPGYRLLATAQQVQTRRPVPRRPFLTGLVLSGNLVSPHQRALILRAFTPLAAQVVADTLDFSVPLAEHISQM